jgi:hypothetical protein
MPYINAELLKREKFSIISYENSVEMNKEKDYKFHLSYSPDLTVQEVVAALKLVTSTSYVRDRNRRSHDHIISDPKIPYFKKMVAVARKVKGPDVVPGSHRHRAQRVILSNGYGQYEI